MSVIKFYNFNVFRRTVCREMHSSVMQTSSAEAELQIRISRFLFRSIRRAAAGNYAALRRLATSLTARCRWIRTKAVHRVREAVL